MVDLKLLSPYWSVLYIWKATRQKRTVWTMLEFFCINNLKLSRTWQHKWQSGRVLWASEGFKIHSLSSLGTISCTFSLFPYEIKLIGFYSSDPRSSKPFETRSWRFCNHKCIHYLFHWINCLKKFRRASVTCASEHPFHAPALKTRSLTTWLSSFPGGIILHDCCWLHSNLFLYFPRELSIHEQVLSLPESCVNMP